MNAFRCIPVLISCLALACPLGAAGPVVILIGPPGSGKTTQAEILKKERGMAVIAADDLIARNPQAFEKVRHAAVQGADLRQDPALNALVEEELGKLDVSKGVILDGYPAAKIQADFLAGLQEKLNLPKAIVIHLLVPDKVVRKRMAKQNAAEVEQRLKDYHREFDFARTYYPQADIRDVDGTKKPDAVAKEIRKLLPPK